MQPFTEKNKNRFILGILFIFQLLVCCYYGVSKESLFCDEVYSYGLANSTKYPFLNDLTMDQQGANNGGWVQNNFFFDYVTVAENEIFSYKQTIENQISDVHPPIYYILLHTFSSFTPEKFSKWTGISLNLLILVFIDFVFYYITIYFFKSREKALLPLILWSFSAAGISNILFIRMYLLQTLQFLLFVATHIYIVKNHRKLSNLKAMLMIAGNVVFGGLTHYYFYVFVFFFAETICIWLLLNRKIKHLFLYITSLLCGFIVNIVVFSATTKHIFYGLRGREAWHYFAIRPDFRDIFKYYYQSIDSSLCGGFLPVIVFVTIVIFIVNLYVNIRRNKFAKTKFSSDEHQVTLFNLAILFSVLLFFLIITRSSGLVHIRYLYSICPFLALFIAWAIFYVLGNIKSEKVKNVLSLLVCVVLCVLSIHKYGIDFQYSELKQEKINALKIRGYDCLLYFDNQWLNAYSDLPVKLYYDETRALRDHEIADLPNILSERRSYDPVVVNIDERFSDEKRLKILHDIIESTSFEDYEHVYHYGTTNAYLLK